MSGRIPPEFIDELLARTDIVDVIGTRIQIRKAGKDFEARCPFHEERTPSFTVSPSKQFYHCFGCGANGSAIGFLMEYDRLSFREAIDELARRAGLTVPVEGGVAASGPDHAPLHALLARASDAYRELLRVHPAASAAVEYLKGRGLSGEIAARFGLGFAPAVGDPILTRLGVDQAAQQGLLTTGLIVEYEGRRRDRFRGRIIFPIRDRRGRVIGFGGRLLGDGKPKYLNSPETPLFHKGRALYGLFEAQQAQRQPGFMLVVEGYLDVIALAQYGLTNVVATLGTATTPEHLQLLGRIAPEVVFCFDGDRAGRAAAWKALQTALPTVSGHQSIRFLFLPEGEDPDTLIRAEGVEAFRTRLQTAQPLSEFLIDQLSRQVDMASMDGRARLVSLAEPLIQGMPGGIYRDLLNQRLVELAGLSSVARPSPSRPARAGVARPGMPPRPNRPSRIALAIALLLNHPELAERVSEVADDWRRWSNPGVEILVQLLEMISSHPTLSKAALVERWREHHHFSYLQRLSVDPILGDIPLEGIVDEFLGALNRISEDVRKEDRRRPLNQSTTTAWSEDARARLEREAAAARTRRR
ncbi:MAG: DNA primase [Sphingobacteriia bacterium]|nr:DNA primase [Sphingobacteriia bacterium]NCC39826.1 DNA primase [Gammaproteobacteria bacterium]